MESIKKIIELVPRVTDANVICELSYPAEKGLLTFRRLNKDVISLIITRDFSCLKSHRSIIEEKFMVNSDNQLSHPESMIDFLNKNDIYDLFRGSVVYRTIRQIQELAVVRGQLPVITKALILLVKDYEIPSDVDTNDIAYVGILLSCLLGESLIFKQPGNIEFTIKHKHGTTTSIMKIKKRGSTIFYNNFSLADTLLINNKIIPELDRHTTDVLQLLSDVYYTVVDIKENVKYDDEVKLLVDVIAEKCNLNKLPGGLQNERAAKYIRL